MKKYLSHHNCKALTKISLTKKYRAISIEGDLSLMIEYKIASKIKKRKKIKI